MKELYHTLKGQQRICRGNGTEQDLDVDSWVGEGQSEMRGCWEQPDGLADGLRTFQWTHTDRHEALKLGGATSALGLQENVLDAIQGALCMFGSWSC